MRDKRWYPLHLHNGAFYYTSLSHQYIMHPISMTLLVYICLDFVWLWKDWSFWAEVKIHNIYCTQTKNDLITPYPSIRGLVCTPPPLVAPFHICIPLPSMYTPNVIWSHMKPYYRMTTWYASITIWLPQGWRFWCCRTKLETQSGMWI